MAWPLAVPAIAAGVALVTSGYQAYRQSREATKQREWQERMSNSAYQRQARDLELAGLNRILGYTKGSGASTPSGAKADVPEFGRAVTTALMAARLEKEIEVMDADIGKKNSETAFIVAQTKGVPATVEKTVQTTKNLITENQRNMLRKEQEATTGEGILGRWLTSVVRSGKAGYAKLMELGEAAKKMGKKDRIAAERILRSLGWKPTKKKGHKPHGASKSINKKALRAKVSPTL